MNGRGLCLLPEDQITSKVAHPGSKVQVVYADDADDEDADYLAQLTFCLMHEYPDKKQNDPSIVQFPTVPDCYGWRK